MSNCRTDSSSLDEDAAGPDSLDFCAIAVDRGSPCCPIGGIVLRARHLPDSEGRLAHSRSIVYMTAGLA